MFALTLSIPFLIWSVIPLQQKGVEPLFVSLFAIVVSFAAITIRDILME
jgi:hypothetical protein